MGIQHFQALTEKQQYLAVTNPKVFQIFEKLDGTGFAIHYVSGRYYSKRVGDSTLYPLHPRDGEPVWEEEIWTQLFRTAHRFFKIKFRDGEHGEDFIISYEILSSDFPNAITYMPYGNKLNLVVELNVNPSYMAQFAGVPSYSEDDLMVVRETVNDELVLTEDRVLEKWIHVPNIQKTNVWRDLLKKVDGSSPIDIIDQFNKDWLKMYSWVPKFLNRWGKAVCCPAPIEGLVVVGPDFKFKMVERNWFLGLTAKNYHFRKKLFKTSHKKTNSVGDVHYQGIQSGLPKRLCDSLAIHRTIDEYMFYLSSPEIHDLSPGPKERNKEAVYTSLKRYGW